VAAGAYDLNPMAVVGSPARAEDQRGRHRLPHVTCSVLSGVHQQSEGRRRQSGPPYCSLGEQGLTRCLTELLECAVQCGVRLVDENAQRTVTSRLDAGGGELTGSERLTARRR
jgi:hypothetical protein